MSAKGMDAACFTFMGTLSVVSVLGSIAILLWGLGPTQSTVFTPQALMISSWAVIAVGTAMTVYIVRAFRESQLD